MIASMNGQSMNKELRLVILKKFDSQSDFAAAIGEHESAVSQVIRGRRVLSDDRKEKWAEALGIRKEDLS